MLVKRVEDLLAWRLAADLKRLVYALVDRTGARNDFRFRDQVKGSAASASNFIADGFRRCHRRDFAYQVGFARMALTETKNRLCDGVDRGYFTAADCGPLVELADRAVVASTRLISLLDANEVREDMTRGR